MRSCGLKFIQNGVADKQGRVSKEYEVTSEGKLEVKTSKYEQKERATDTDMNGQKPEERQRKPSSEMPKCDIKSLTRDRFRHASGDEYWCTLPDCVVF